MQSGQITEMTAQNSQYRFALICCVILAVNLFVSFGDQITADEIELVLSDKNIFVTGFKDGSSISAFTEDARRIPLISIPNSILQSVIYLNKSYLIIRFLGFVKLLLVCFFILELVKDKRLALLFVLMISFGANHFKILVNRPELDILLSIVFFMYLQSGKRTLLGFELIRSKRTLIILYLLNIAYLVSAHPKSILYYPIILIVLPKIIESRRNQVLIGILIVLVVGFSWHQKARSIREIGILRNIADSYFIDIMKSKGELAPKMKALRINFFNQDARLDSLELNGGPFSVMNKYYDKNSVTAEIFNLNVNLGFSVIFFLALFSLLTFEKNYPEKLVVAGTFAFAAVLANKNYYNASHIVFMLSLAIVLWIGRSNKYQELIQGVVVVFLVIWTFNTITTLYIKYDDLDYSLNKFNITASNDCRVPKADGVVLYDTSTFSYLPWNSRAGHVAYLEYLDITDPRFYRDKFRYALLKDCDNIRLNAFIFIEKTAQENGFCCYRYREK